MYYFTTEQYAQILDSFANSTSGFPEADRYAKIYELIQLPDAFGSTAPSNVIAWFGAAAQANRGIGGASDFIRDYTQAQLEIRTGGPVSNIESILQNASNRIAAKVFDDISGHQETINGQVYYILPTAHQIGVNDATEAMSELEGISSDIGIWSGNPLFLGLGDASFWNENIVNENNPGYTYDLFATLASFKSAGLSTFLNGGTADLLDLFWSQGQEGRAAAASTVSNAYTEGNAFLTSAYGGYIGSGIAQFLVREVVVGSDNEDAGLEEGSIFTDNTLIHAGAGDDFLIGSLGNDLLDGGAGDNDFASFEALSSGTSLQFQVTLDSIDSTAQFSAEVSAENVQSGLFNIEELHLGVNNDTLIVRQLSGITTALNTINALSEETDGEFDGDTINLSQAVFSGATVSLADETISMNDTAYTLNVINFENVVGSSFEDTITGNASNNILYGGEGADSLSGGAGDDILIFDADDTLVDGGAGRDVGIVSGEAGVTVDLAASGLEVVVGSVGADNFTLDSTGSTVLMAAGGAGGDTFTVNGGGTTVVWGGAGADIFNINEEGGSPHGILTVNVEGLTADNFADFNLDMLDLGAGFNWDAIDMVVLNPDSEDRFFVNGNAIGVGGQRTRIIEDYAYSGPDDEEGTLIEVGNFTFDALSEYEASFLGGSITSVQMVTQIYDYVGFASIDNDTGETSEIYMPETDDEQYTAENANFTRNYTAYVFDEGETENLEYEAISYYWVGTKEGLLIDGSSNADREYNDYNNVYYSWFVAGGTFGNLDLSTNGSISVTMPEDDTGFSVTDWLASVSGDIGGGGDDAPDPNNPNYSSGTGPSTFSSFSTGTSTLTFNGTATDPNNTTAGYSMAQVGANVEVDFGGGDVVTLENVTLTVWQAAATTQFFGSATGETLTGTSQGEVFSAGAGDDLIIAGSGDDTINYVAGDDVIKGHKSNYGNDTLDLSQYTADQVSFRIVGHDVFIDTPDGTIELDYQARYEVGHARTNIENIIFSDGTLDDAAIRDRAIADQTSAGDDVVTGSFQTDTISTGAGNDIIYAGSGDDTIIYTSGDDVIIGNNTGYNYGNDTLDLSQYTADQVSFRIVGHDVFIDTLDGSIELDYQVRNELGDARLNIENIIFSDGTLDEAGIAARAISDQASSGDDVITGSFQSEVITGGAGNDTLSGVSGSDTFVFAVGDGVDVITDYDAANDALEFIGINFSDLTITQTGSDVLIEYGTGDQVLVTDAGIDMFNEPEFLFA